MAFSIRKGLILLSAVGVLSTGNVSRADDGDAGAAATPDAASKAVVATPEKQSKILGTLDMRPSWVTGSGRWHSENTTSLGYQFNANRKLEFVQFWNTNLGDPQSSFGAAPLQAVVDDALIKASFDNLWVSPDGTVSMALQPRIYLPTEPTKRAAGYIGKFRNSFILKKKLSPQVSMSFYEVPMLYAYNAAGSVSNGEAAANPVFENAAFFVTDISLFGDKVSLSIPVMFHSVVYRNFQAGASNNGATTHLLWIWPEVDYSISDHLSLGVAFYSDNMLMPDLSGSNFGPAFQKGVVQLVMTAML